MFNVESVAVMLLQKAVFGISRQVVTSTEHKKIVSIHLVLTKESRNRSHSSPCKVPSTQPPPPPPRESLCQSTAIERGEALVFVVFSSQ